MISQKRPALFLMMTAILLMLFGGNVWAFPDAEEDPNAAAIHALQEAGIINGSPDGSFRPNAKLSYAEGVSMLVKAFDLNFDHIRFIKMPQAGDSYDYVKDGKWYSDAFIIASYYLDVPREVKPDQKMTREQFAQLLFRSISVKGDFAYPEIYMMVADEAEIDPSASDSIQKLLISRIVSLDENGKFHPGQMISRGEAAGWLHGGREFVRMQLEREVPVQPEEPASHPLYDLHFTVHAVNERVNEVIVTAQAPHPGYGLRIASIRFEGSDAIMDVEAIEPDPDRMYPQVITEVQASVFVGSEYEPVLTGGGSAGSAGSVAISNPIAQ